MIVCNFRITAAKRAYRARRTLLIQYENDAIDETEKLKVGKAHECGPRRALAELSEKNHEISPIIPVFFASFIKLLGIFG